MSRYHYEPGTVRWHRFSGDGDVRAYRAPPGWGNVQAELLDRHPLTGRPFATAQWWLREERTDAL